VQTDSEKIIQRRVKIFWTIVVIVTVSAVIFIINNNFVHHPLWHWLKLLIVPAVLAGGGLWFNAQQREREQQTAHDRAQDEALQAYLDGMAELLTDKDLPLHSAQPGDSLCTVARARTLTVLGRLDGGRKGSVMQFLYESGLIYKERTLLKASDLIERRHNIVSLHQADLSDADLSWAYLIEADLSDADLREANLIGADLLRANLIGADLRGANLSGAQGWTGNLLSRAGILDGATMPDGQTLAGAAPGPTFADWLRHIESC
jgi:Pentapeptide repeats (8 copies)